MKGVVLKSTGKWYRILLDTGQTVKATIKGKLRLKEANATNPVAAGDYVTIQSASSGDEEVYAIDAILERENYLVRRSTNLSKQVQIIAANIDRVYLLVTIKYPVTQLGFIDRFLVAAESFRIKTSILVNKMDLYSESELKLADELVRIYQKIGYPCHKISAIDGNSLAFLKEEIKDKKVMISGNSGVGKTSLVNSLDPALDLKVGEISISHEQGKHTTTFAEMHPLESGGFIIDTPGIRAFGLAGLDKEHYAHYFPEMRDLLGKCKFHNCVHLEEPECQIKKLVHRGEIAESRYATYLQLMEEDATDPYRRNQHK